MGQFLKDVLMDCLKKKSTEGKKINIQRNFTWKKMLCIFSLQKLRNLGKTEVLSNVKNTF